MPSFKEQGKSIHRALCRRLANSIYTFCSIASLGVISILTLSTPAFADQTSKSLDVNLTLGNSISVRILDSTATSDLSLLSFDLTPTAAGVTSTKRAIVDVSTSNITGYKLYVEANGKDHNNQYTTDLVQGDTADSHVIPTSTSTASNKNFWNYVNPATSTATVVPAHGNPDQIGMLMSPTTSTKANVDINVGVDTTITAGSYTNQLLFTAIANAESIDYTLYFDKNAPSGVDPSTIENFPVNQTATSSATSYTFTIPDTAPTLVGYTFGGYVDPAATPGSKGSSADPYLPGDDVTVVADTSASVISGTKTLNAKWSIIRPTLTVDPDGGTWSGSTTPQTFTQDYDTTKYIALPSQNATYAISYNDNSQGATFTPTPTSTERSFTEWQLAATRSAGPGSWDPATSTYTFGTQNGTLTAIYNETSNTFTLPTVTKTGHTCTWHEGSASGTSHTSGETNVTISANTEFFAVCTANPYNVTVTAGTGIDSVTGGGSKEYGSTVTLGYTESTGYHFTGWTTVSGGVTVDANNQFTMPDNDVEVTANGAINTCPITYNSNTPSGSSASGSTANSSMTYNQTATLTTNGYTVTGYQFDGWATTSDGAVAYTTTIPAADTATYCTTHNTTKTLYAHWTKLYTYTLNLNYNDGTTNKQVLNYPSSGGTTSTSRTFSNLNNYAPTRSGYNFLGWATTTTGTTYYTSRTLYGSSASSTPTTDGFPVTGNLYAIWEAAAYTVTVSNSNTTSGATSITVPMGGSATVTVTPSSNYYLSAVSCPSGFTCSGYSTGTKASTSVQTVTVTHSTATSGGTLSFTGGKIGKIQYVANAPSGSTTVGGMSDQKIVYLTSASDDINESPLNSSTSTVTLYAPSWTISGYGFKGWNTAANGSGTMYGPNQTITLSSSQKTALVSTNGLQLYAQWVASAGNMASWTGCASLAPGSVTALTYSGDTYAVAKLADGKCWMIENLRTSTNAGTSVSKFTDNVYTNKEYNLGNVTSTTASSATSARRSYGGYYSWASAINSTTEHTTPKGNPDSTTGAVQGICPTGWRLPRISYDGSESGVNTDYPYLGSKIGTTAGSFRKYPNNFVLSGLMYGGSSSVSYRGKTGTYLSSSVYASTDPVTYAYALELHSKSADAPKYLAYKDGGHSVRCVMVPSLNNITQMQQMTSDICASTAVGTTKTLTDTRDSKTYSVTKLADGKCWMTQNLRLVGSRTLTSSDSDVSSNFTLPASSTDGWCTDATDSSCYSKSLVLDSGNTSYGVYYTHYAATAGTAVYDNSSAGATSSICPKGWKLPSSGGSSSDIALLIAQYNTKAALTSAPANFVNAGDRWGSNTADQGSKGYIWARNGWTESSTSKRAGRVLDLNKVPEYTGGFYAVGGLPVRCVAR